MSEDLRPPKKPSLTESGRIRVAQRARTAEDLLTPVEAILQVVDGLLESRPATDGELLQDLARIGDAARRFRDLCRELFRQADTRDASIAFSLQNLPREERHELRTPMNHVIGYAELLLEVAREAGDPELEIPLAKVLSWGRRLLEMFNRLTAPAAAGAPPRPGIDTNETMVQNLVRSIRPVTEDEAVARDKSHGRILIADDNDINRDILCHQLARLGHHTGQVTNGVEALEAVRREPWDVLLLDVMMPVKNGFEVLCEIRADEELRHIPVIMLSALDEVSSVVRCIEIGAEDYLAKPFEWVVLKARIAAALEKKRLRDREVKYLRRIDDERKFSDRLLHVILPEQVIKELRATERVRPRRHDDVAVLFTDIVGFTSYCDAHQPEEVVGQLQDLVEAFEELTSRRGLYKVKTVGDAFMATAGLLQPVDNPVLCCLELAIDMQAATRRIASHWQIRTGIHVGPVVAGVLGRQQFQFDLWGDTVNTAARMVAAALPGRVALSEQAFRRVRGCALGKSLGRLDVKGKGKMEVFLFERFGEAR